MAASWPARGHQLSRGHSNSNINSSHGHRNSNSNNRHVSSA